MSVKGNAVSITATITAARAAKADSTKVETFQDGTTYNQYVVRAKEVKGSKYEHATFTPDRRWTSLTAEEDAVLCYKSLGSVIAATAQEQMAHQVDGAYFAWLGEIPVAEQVANGTKGFGTHDRIFEVAMTPVITELLAASASFSGEEHVDFFKGKTERRKAERKAYRTLSDPAVAKLVAILREQD